MHLIPHIQHNNLGVAPVKKNTTYEVKKPSYTNELTAIGHFHPLSGCDMRSNSFIDFEHRTNFTHFAVCRLSGQA